MKELQISAIKEGVVIDHIPSLQAFKIVEMLALKKYKEVVTVALNLESKSLEKKGIIKIAGRALEKSELDKISILAPQATVNFIKDYEVIEKKYLEVPEVIDNIIKCNNIKCISNHENIHSKFINMENAKMTVRCFYCERVIHEEDILTK